MIVHFRSTFALWLSDAEEHSQNFRNRSAVFSFVPGCTKKVGIIKCNFLQAVKYPLWKTLSTGSEKEKSAVSVPRPLVYVCWIGSARTTTISPRSQLIALSIPLRRILKRVIGL